MWDDQEMRGIKSLNLANETDHEEEEETKTKK